MKRLLTFLILLTTLVIPFTTYAQGLDTYTLDPNHTYVLWSINHFGFSIQYGKFTMITGTLQFDKVHPENSKLQVTVPINSLVTGLPKLNEHLLSEQFFNAAKFPAATFLSNRIVVNGTNTGKVYGTFTLLGIAKPLVLNVTILKSGISPLLNKQVLGFTATAHLKRSDYGMEAFLPMLGDDVDLIIGTEADSAS